MSEPSFEAAFRVQAHLAGETGSPLVSGLLAEAAQDVADGGPVARLTEGWRGHPVLDNLPLRLMGAVHALVLSGRAPALAAYFPSTGGHFDPVPAWRAMRRLIEEHADTLRPRLSDQLQTNEVRRCCALLGGFLRIARDLPHPLRLLEVGSSGGLNLGFDRYRYQLGPHEWGPSSELRLDTEWRGPAPDTRATLQIASREGCDLAPIDVTDPEARLRLESFIWPDQSERLARLRAAVQANLAEPPRLAREPAGRWIQAQLRAPAPDRTSVVFHSVMWLYLSEDEREAITGTLNQAGGNADARAPIAWLRMEGASPKHCDVRLTTWPGAEERHLARAHYHAEWVEWLA